MRLIPARETAVKRRTRLLQAFLDPSKLWAVEDFSSKP